MWGLGLRLWRAFRAWEGPLQGAACIALSILALALSAAIFGPLALRGPALLGAFGALVALQLLVMWSLRSMQTAQSLAWRAFQRSDFARCSQLLEMEYRAGRASRSMQLLLAVAYRQQGLLKESEALARQLTAADARYFPAWRALGQALLASGDFSEAAVALAQAGESHADSRVELGLARYLVGERDAAAADMREALAAVGLSASHAWLAGRILGGAGEEQADGSVYWREEAACFSHTEYGAALAEFFAERSAPRATP